MEHLLAMGSRNTYGMMDAVLLRNLRIRFEAGHGSFPMVGTPDHVAGELAKISAAGFTGIAFSFVMHLGEFPSVRDEVLPRLERLGLRESTTSRS